MQGWRTTDLLQITQYIIDPEFITERLLEPRSSEFQLSFFFYRFSLFKEILGYHLNTEMFHWISTWLEYLLI